MKFWTFKKDEDGAVTVDFVVLCAGVVIIAVAAAAAMRTRIVEFVDSITYSVNVSTGGQTANADAVGSSAGTGS